MLLLVPSDFSKSRNKALWYGQWYWCFHRYTRKILTGETATGNPSVTSCRVWELQKVFFPFYTQSLALESERSQIQKAIFIVLIKSFNVNEYIPIAVESQHIVLALNWAMYRCMYFNIRYGICYGIPIIVMMQIFFTLPFTATIVQLKGRVKKFASSQWWVFRNR